VFVAKLDREKKRAATVEVFVWVFSVGPRSRKLRAPVGAGFRRCTGDVL
jgi:hypothetical protein